MNLFSMRTNDNILFWNIVRDSVHLKMWELKGCLESPEGKRHYKKPIFRFPQLLLDAFINEICFFRLKPKDTLIICVSRNLDDQQNPTDLILIDYLRYFKNNYNIIEVYQNNKYKSFDTKYRNRYFLNSLELKKKISSLFKKKTEPQFELISNALNQIFEINYDWASLMNPILDEYRIGYKFYTKVLKRLKPKYFIFSQMSRPAVAAANNLGIRTIEVLHGCPTPSCTTWMYQKNIPEQPSAPKEILTFSAYWHKLIGDNFKKWAIGNSFFYSLRKKDLTYKKTFTSISSIFTYKAVSTSTHALAKLLPEYTFYLKLQSSEIDHIQLANEKFRDCPNVKVIFNELNVNQLFEISDFLILVQSSCTYQALQNGLKVFILKELYYIESQDIFASKDVYPVGNADEIMQHIIQLENEGIPENSEYHFFNKFDESKFKEILDKSEV